MSNLYNTVDKLVMIKNTLQDYKPKNKSRTKKDGKLSKGLDVFNLLTMDFNNCIREIQKFYPYINYSKMIDDNAE